MSTVEAVVSALRKSRDDIETIRHCHTILEILNKNTGMTNGVHCRVKTNSLPQFCPSH